MKFCTCFFLLICFVSLSCGEPEDNNNLESFELVGKWFFQEVSGSGVIFGLPQSDKDETPSGYVEFYEGGLGLSEFSTTLLGQTIAKSENIQWKKISEFVIDIEEEDGVHEIWTLVNANNLALEAEWDIEIAGNTATVVAKLSK